jgi:AcrR family transcriptional regulator
MSPAGQRTRRTQIERTDEAKARIRVAALELFALQGYEATNLAEISLRAGYSRALAQYHYADKSALAIELLEARMRRGNAPNWPRASPQTRGWPSA